MSRNQPLPADRSALRVQQWNVGPVIVLTLSGLLTSDTSGTLERPLVRALAARMPPLVVVDVARTDEIDSAGHALLADAARYAAAAGGRLIVAGGSGDAAGATAAAAMPTLEEALSELARPARRGPTPPPAPSGGAPAQH
ncbi:MULTISPECIES: STAS domain-containing protein [unclassified Nonomuraea]|uniref:STAS domain-containing protein n=1 Tax=unclassified Nonomuraea TaxID=2593643 RepID=UPI0033EAA713